MAGSYRRTHTSGMPVNHPKSNKAYVRLYESSSSPDDEMDEDEDGMTVSRAQVNLHFADQSAGYTATAWALAISPHMIAYRQEYTMDEWLHVRFCHVYPVHGWVHNQFARALLWSRFSYTYQVPSPELAISAACLAVTLPLAFTIPAEMWNVVINLLILDGADNFTKFNLDPNVMSDISFDIATINETERGCISFCWDAVSLAEDDLLPPSGCVMEKAFHGIMNFFFEPESIFQDKSDILALPLLRDDNEDIYDGLPLYPDFRCLPYPVLIEGDPLCTCGICHNVNAQMHHSRNLRIDYSSVVKNAQDRGCDAISVCWEHVWSKVDMWVDAVKANVQFPDLELFPSENEQDHPIGPTVIDVLNTCGLTLDAGMSPQQLLIIIVAMRYAHCSRDEDITLPRLCPVDGFGMIFRKAGNPWIVTNSGWLLDNASSADPNRSLATVHFLTDCDEFKVDYHSLRMKSVISICFPPIETPDRPLILPQEHDSSAVNETPPSLPMAEDTSQVVLCLSELRNYAFPLLSLGSAQGGHETLGVAAELSILYNERLIQTWYRPDVVVGPPCAHRQAHRVQMRCASTAHAILMSVEPTTEGLSSLIDSLKANLRSSHDECYDLLGRVKRDWSTRTARLTAPSNALERHRLTIVMCGEEDGPADAVIILAAALGKKVYVFNRRERWQCACIQMLRLGRTVGLAEDTKIRNSCSTCYQI